VNTRYSLIVLFILSDLIASCGGAPQSLTSTSIPAKQFVPKETSAPSAPTYVSPTSTVDKPSWTPTVTLTGSPTTDIIAPLSGLGGGRIVFGSKRTGNHEIYVMNADGSGQRQLTNNPYEDAIPVWSPDGTRIAFSRYAPVSKVYIVDVDGSNQRLLAEGSDPAWSPDGKQIIFSRDHPYADLYIMNADGSNQQQLTDTGREFSVSGADWSPDGRWIACVINSNPVVDGIQNELSTINIFELPDIQQNAGNIKMHPLPRAGKEINDRPRWSPDSTQILFSAVDDFHRAIFLVNVDGSNLTRITQDSSVNEFGPSWSPDGTQVIFQASPQGSWDIFIMNLDDTNHRQLTFWGDNDVSPDWKP
jgi:Tol biopolymer transport system component